VEAGRTVDADAAVGAADSEDVRVLDRAEAELEDVERALERLDQGSYDRCEVCGGGIGHDRLASSPLTRRCAGHVAGGASSAPAPAAAPAAPAPAPAPAAPVGSPDSPGT
jgi:hypothetical protein